MALEMLQRQMDGLSGGGIERIEAGTNVTVDNPDGPIATVNATGGGGGAVSSVSGTGAIDATPTTGAVVISLDEAELENGGSQEISIAGLSGRAGSAQTADQIVESGGPTTLTVASVADFEVLQRFGSTVRGLSGLTPNYEYYRHPASVNNDDTEGEGLGLNAFWSVINHGFWTTPVASSGAVDTTATSLTLNTINQSDQWGGSKWAMQPQALNSGLVHRYTNWPSRINIRWRPWITTSQQPSVIAAQNQILFYFATENAGVPDLSLNYNRVEITSDVAHGGGAYDLRLVHRNQSSGAENFGTQTPIGDGFRDFEIISIVNFVASGNTSTIDHWAQSGSGLHHLGSVTLTQSGFTTADPGWLYMRCINSNAAPFSPIFAWDYIRFNSGPEVVV